MSRASKGFRYAGMLLRAAAVALSAGVVLVLVLRIFSSGTPKELDAMTPNDRLAAAYAEQGRDLYMFKQGHPTVTTAERNRGYFGITDCYIIPDADQIQLVFRYNNSTVRSLAEDYELAAVPDTSDELFDVSLVLQTDLTPDDDSDNGGNVKGAVAYKRIMPSSVVREQTKLYNYFRYTFDLGAEGLDLSELIDSGELLATYLDIYYNEDIDYESTAYGTLFIYDYKAKALGKKLSSRDVRAIEQYAEEIK